ncbi:hypothetical protein BH11PLA2_BH11PLA2_42850 [soil metagenome]
MKTMLTLFLLSLTVSAAEPFTSGVPVGKRPGPYSFLVATGPQRGQPTCYICEQDNKPTAVVFVRSLSAPLGKLLVKLDEVATKQADQGFKAWMTQLTPTADLDALAKWSKQEGLKTVAVGAFEDADGPPAYTLHKDADVTVLVFIKKSVTANFALKQDELNDAKIDDILKAVAALK